MQSEKIVFIVQPGRTVVCESAYSSIGEDPETRDLYEYARIVPSCAPVNLFETKWVFTGDIEWTKHADMLTPEHRREIEIVAAKMREDGKDAIAKAKREQEINIRMWNK